MSELTQEMLDGIKFRIEQGGYREYRSCSLRTLHGLQKYFDFITDDMVFSSFALAGGAAQATQGSCGALCGGLIALGAKYLPRRENPSEEEIKKISAVRKEMGKFRDWFISEFGGVTCQEGQVAVYGQYFQLSNPEQYNAFYEYQERNGINCNLLVTKTAIKVAEMLSRDA